MTFCPNVDDRISTRSYRGIRMEFQAFLLRQLIGWNRQQPELVRQLCLVLVRQNTVEGYLEEINLYDLLKVAYPVTSNAPSHGDAG